MAKGRKTGGRTKGTPNKDKAVLLQRFFDIAGHEPMEVLAKAVKAAMDANEPHAAAQIAKDALPYMYPRLSSVEATLDGVVGTYEAFPIPVDERDPLDLAEGAAERGDS